MDAAGGLLRIALFQADLSQRIQGFRIPIRKGTLRFFKVVLTVEQDRRLKVTWQTGWESLATGIDAAQCRTTSSTGEVSEHSPTRCLTCFQKFCVSKRQLDLAKLLLSIRVSPLQTILQNLQGCDRAFHGFQDSGLSQIDL